MPATTSEADDDLPEDVTSAGALAEREQLATGNELTPCALLDSYRWVRAERLLGLVTPYPDVAYAVTVLHHLHEDPEAHELAAAATRKRKRAEKLSKKQWKLAYKKHRRGFLKAVVNLDRLLPFRRWPLRER
jgi:hypothetical protein